MSNNVHLTTMSDKENITISISPPKMVSLNRKIDFADMCRTCGETCKENVSLLKFYKTSDKEIQISEMLTMYTNLKIELSNGLPSMICFDCMSNLIEVHQFVEKCKNTDMKIRKYAIDIYNNDTPVNNTNNIMTYNTELLCNINCNDELETKTVAENTIEKQKVKARCSIKTENNITDNETMQYVMSCKKNIVEEANSKTDNVQNLKGTRCKSITKNKTIQYDTRYKNNNFGTEIIKKSSLNNKKLKMNTRRRKYPVKVIESVCEKLDINKDIIFDESIEINSDKLVRDTEMKYQSNNSNDLNTTGNTIKNILETEKLESKQCKMDEKLLSDKINDEISDKMEDKSNKGEIKSESGTNRLAVNKSDELKRILHQRVKDCPYCSKTFFKLETFQAHMKLHAGILPFKCDLCSKEYADSRGLIQHKKLKHAENPNLKYKCRRIDCDAVYVSWAEIQEHNKTHVKNYYECKICQKTFSYLKGYNKHQKMHLGIHEKFSCDICGKVLETQSSLYMHTRYHKKEYSEICSICGKGFYTPFSLKKHTNSSHSDIKLYQCELCGKELKTLDSLNLHKLSIHIKQPNISCQLCPRKFITRNRLNEHMRIHKKEYKFNCDVCEYKCYTKREFEVHHLRHTGERPFKCDKCPKTYTRLQLYKKHIARHNGPRSQCNICYSFFSPDIINKHRNTHKISETEIKIEDLTDSDEDSEEEKH